MKLTNNHLQTIINALRVYEEKLMEFRVGDSHASVTLQKYMDGSLGDLSTNRDVEKPEHELRLDMVRDILQMIDDEIYGQLEIDLSLNQGRKVSSIQ